MQKIISFLLALQVFFNLSFASGLDLNEMKKWERKYPRDSITGKSIFESRSFQVELLKVLDKKNYHKFQKYLKVMRTEAPIEVENNILNFSICRVHVCSDYNYNFYINLKTSELSVCENINGKIVWYGPLKNEQPKSELSCYWP